MVKNKNKSAAELLQTLVATRPSIFKPYAIYIRIPSTRNIIRIHNIDFESGLMEFIPVRVYDGNYAQIDASINFIFTNLMADKGIWIKPVAGYDFIATPEEILKEKKTKNRGCK